MPRFAANLSMLFTERPFLGRFGAAAAAGFRAVEVQEPYEVSASAVRAELDLVLLERRRIGLGPGRAHHVFAAP